MTELHTPQAISDLEEAVRSDLASASALFVEGAKLLEVLEESLRLLPTTQARVREWRKSLEVLAGHIAEEQADVSRKLLGTDTPPIEQHTDEEHSARVLSLKKESA